MFTNVFGLEQYQDVVLFHIWPGLWLLWRFVFSYKELPESEATKYSRYSLKNNYNIRISCLGIKKIFFLIKI